jgi:uncharacterized protein DUF2568
MAALRAINLGVRFLLELAALTSFAYWGGTLPATSLIRIIAAITLPLIVAVFWGFFVAPKARIPTGRLGRAGLGLIVFLAGAAALFDRGHGSIAQAFAAVAIVSSLVVYALPQ